MSIVLFGVIIIVPQWKVNVSGFIKDKLGAFMTLI
jgi:hypothetical protein